MAYRIKKFKYKSITGVEIEHWRLIYEKYQGSIRTQRHVPKEEWPAIGFSKNMTIDDAKAFAKQLNNSARLKWVEEKRNNISKKLQEFKLIDSVFLPQEFIKQFEQEVIFRKLGRGNVASIKYHSIPSHWLAAQRLIHKVQLEPSEWYDNPESIYGYIEDIQASPSYAQKILRVLNLWGHFICRKTSKAFLAIPTPRGYAAERIADAHHEKHPNGLESAPITPDEIHQAKIRGLREDNFNWLYIAIWFGLRPNEVDDLKNIETYKISNDGSVDVISIYQSKLKSIRREKRWKHIPILEKEQAIALELIKKGLFKRPLVKTIKSYVNPQGTTYGPRKGFVTLMHMDRGHDMAHVSSWLGHQSVDRTWKNYRDKNQVLYKKKA